jgi:hypothetical protein
MDLVRKALTALSNVRPIFHSEADFQHAFAWAIHVADPNSDVRLEAPFHTSEQRQYLDLVVRRGEREIGVELKYKTRRLLAETKAETFLLENQGAQDQGRYDFFKDIRRLEQFVATSASRSGLAAFLTNDNAYWKPVERLDAGYSEFAMTEGRIVGGTLAWQAAAGAGTRRSRDDAITLAGQYRLEWEHYSTLQCRLPRPGPYGRFRYVVAEVVRNGGEPSA